MTQEHQTRASRSAHGAPHLPAPLTALAAALAALPEFAGITAEALEPMAVKGLAHAHVRIRGRGLVLRLPRYSYFGVSPADNIAYQAECYRRAADSGATPKLHAAIPPSPEVPNGALVVEEIVGRAPVLPGDMAMIADALAAIHALPVPLSTACPPLRVHVDPVAATLVVIEAQADFLAASGVPRATVRAIEDEIRWARDFAGEASKREHVVTLVGSDTHPGNFLVTRDGRAIFVDFERMLYGSPAIDLAHASIYTSTMWDADVAAALVRPDIEAFYRHYLARVPARLAIRLQPWLVPLRRLTWLRTTTWCAKWRVESDKPPRPDGAVASAATQDPAYIAAVRARIADYFDPATVARIRSEWLEGDPLELGG
jgi:aminoglycoside phosphotransferase (APT) family kinase protein